MKNRLLIVEDDDVLRQRLASVLSKHGFEIVEAESIESAKRNEFPLTHAILDLKIKDGWGTDLLKYLRDRFPYMRIVILTGFGSIASAVQAIKAGADDFLTKPMDLEILVNVLKRGSTSCDVQKLEQPMTPSRARWEHIQRVFLDMDRNVSATARQLQMHRRTLQRILSKHAPR